MDKNPKEASEGKAVVEVLASVLVRLVSSNAHVPSDANVTKFHALKAPAISVHQYLERIHKYASCSTECFILALIYIDRLIQRNNFILSDLNVHRVCITAILLAAKFFDDAYYNNAYYAKVGGVLVSEMNSLEVEFLFRINFSLHVSPEVFHKYQCELISHAAGAGLERPKAMDVEKTFRHLAPTHVHHPTEKIMTSEREKLMEDDFLDVNQPFEHCNHQGTYDGCIDQDCVDCLDAFEPEIRRHITPSPTQASCSSAPSSLAMQVDIPTFHHTKEGRQRTHSLPADSTLQNPVPILP